MRTGKFAIAAAVAALSFTAAGESAAQACIGTPTVSGQRALTMGAGFPDWGTNYQARLDVNTTTPLSAHGAFAHTSTTGDAPNVNTLGAGVAYRLPAPAAGQIEISACPTAGVEYSLMNASNFDHTHLVVPVGIGLGARLPIGNGMAVSPYVRPEFYVTRTSLRQEGQRQTTDDTGLRATVGSTLDFGPFFAGVDYVTHYQVDPRDFSADIPLVDRGMNSALGLRVGVKF